MTEQANESPAEAKTEAAPKVQAAPAAEKTEPAAAEQEEAKPAQPAHPAGYVHHSDLRAVLAVIEHDVVGQCWNFYERIKALVAKAEGAV